MYNNQQNTYQQNTFIPSSNKKGDSNSKKDLATLKVSKYPDRKSIKTTEMISINDLASEINQALKLSLLGYTGCNIIQSPTTGECIVNLYFSNISAPAESDLIPVIKDLSVTNNSSTSFNRLKSFSNKQSKTLYDLTDEAKEVLSAFRNGQRDPKRKFNLSQVVDKTYDRLNGIIYLMVSDLSLLEFVKFLRPRKVNDDIIDYNIVLTNAYMAKILGGNRSQYIEIHGYNRRLVNELVASIKPQANIGEFPIIRA